MMILKVGAVLLVIYLVCCAIMNIKERISQRRHKRLWDEERELKTRNALENARGLIKEGPVDCAPAKKAFDWLKHREGRTIRVSIGSNSDSGGTSGVWVVTPPVPEVNLSYYVELVWKIPALGRDSRFTLFRAGCLPDVAIEKNRMVYRFGYAVSDRGNAANPDSLQDVSEWISYAFESTDSAR